LAHGSDSVKITVLTLPNPLMKKIIRSLVASGTFAALALVTYGQTVKIHVVDMAKLYDNHYKTIEQNAKIQSDDQKAQVEVEKLNKEGNVFVEEYKALNDQANNPALSAEAKTKSQGDAQRKLEAIQTKQREIQTFMQNTRNSLQQRLKTFRSLILEEISKLATDVAKRKGATLLFDKAGPSMIGISNVVYADPIFDITDDVMKELNKDRPATAPALPVPAASPTANTVPGVTPKK
jgi:outer membrane protein